MLVRATYTRACVKLVFANMEFYNSLLAGYKSITLIVYNQNTDFSVLGNEKERIVRWRGVQSDVCHGYNEAVIPSSLLPITVRSVTVTR